MQKRERILSTIIPCGGWGQGGRPGRASLAGAGGRTVELPLRWKLLTSLMPTAAHFRHFTCQGGALPVKLNRQARFVSCS